MSLTPLLIINQIDFSSGIKAGSYNICTKQMFKEFEDANKSLHKRFLRNKVEGKFEIFFRTMAQYDAFKAAIEAVKSSTDSSVPITVFDTKANELKNINAFLEYTPSVNLDGTMQAFIDPFEIKVEER